MHRHVGSPDDNGFRIRTTVQFGVAYRSCVRPSVCSGALANVLGVALEACVFF
ncbi:hypothetical protein AArcS_1889 [Natranaeroarchaeum sulfidigenes]|uniref:Uncharacterized protein n=1 Tax=Natranaeroarchaeum sulfidigenes TaxID=2784880 RepID=A0A897MY99_9EURY|nr:hypothetical protein AArcS_1889 [Natranaeroarchaeum sulfidigenes]